MEKGAGKNRCAPVQGKGSGVEGGGGRARESYKITLNHRVGGKNSDTKEARGEGGNPRNAGGGEGRKRERIIAKKKGRKAVLASCGCERRRGKTSIKKEKRGLLVKEDRGGPPGIRMVGSTTIPW